VLDANFTTKPKQKWMEELLNLKKEIETLKRAAEISEINTDQK